MPPPLTRRDACEAYTHRWQAKYFDQAMWARVLESLYAGKSPTAIVQLLELNQSCLSSLTVHAREHRGYIAFVRAVRIKDKRLALGAGLSTAWQSLIDRVFAISLDESTKPGVAIRGAEMVRREMQQLTRLAEAVEQEFEGGEQGTTGEPQDVQATIEQIARDVFGVRSDG